MLVGVGFLLRRLSGSNYLDAQVDPRIGRYLFQRKAERSRRSHVRLSCGYMPPRRSRK